MGLFQKLFHRREDSSRQPVHRAAPVEQADAHVCGGQSDLDVVGESGYQTELWQIVGRYSSTGDRVRREVCAVLIAEKDNTYDGNAVSVWVNGLRVSYLPRDDASQYRPGLLALGRKFNKPIALIGVIAGCGLREDGPGRLGLFLKHDPADFGLEDVAPTRTEPEMRTGL